MVTQTRADAIARTLGVVLGVIALTAQAASPALRTEGINISADLQESSLREDEHVLTGNVRITQADMSMEAGKATVSGMQSDHSRVLLEHAVHIRSAQADLRADDADARFARGQLDEATVKGSPAQFEQLNVASDKKVTGHANVIEYDFGKGTVKMSQDVWFSYGDNEIRADTVVYNLIDQRVVVNPGAASGNGNGGRVNITIRPGSIPALPASKNAPKKPDSDGNKE